jgi:hypothetical protein
MDLYLLSHLVQQGRYHVPAERVAEAIISLIRPELLFTAPGRAQGTAGALDQPVEAAPYLPG